MVMRMLPIVPSCVSAVEASRYEVSLMKNITSAVNAASGKANGLCRKRESMFIGIACP